MMKNKLLKTIYESPKTIVGYFPYPTWAMYDSIIVKTSNGNSQKYNHELKNFVSLIVALGAKSATYSIDNKTAVALKIEGLDVIYAGQSDGTYYISKAINKKYEDRIKIYETIY